MPQKPSEAARGKLSRNLIPARSYASRAGRSGVPNWRGEV